MKNMENNFNNHFYESNQNLIKFCNRIITYNSILDDETTRNIFLVSLMSADSLIDKYACDESIEISSFILNNIDLFVLEDNVKETVIKYLKDAIEISNKEKNNFK